MPKKTLRYRLALDLGTTSLGWAMLRLGKDGQPCGIVRAGVRIFSDGRNPKDGSSLAVTRRAARAMRRRRDRLLRRKARMMQQLIDFGFFPQDAVERKRLELLNPYELRARGLDAALTPGEFARALFHINQRRGFKSNRRTDKGADEKEAGALKTAIKELRERMKHDGARTVGEWLWRQKKGKNVRARPTAMSGTTVTGYDLYIDRAMVAAEFDALWAKQAALNPAVFTEERRAVLRDILLYQRKLRPVNPGRCTLLPDEKRAPRALPAAQRFRVLQDINHLRISSCALCVVDMPLTQAQRDALLAELEEGKEITFASLRGRKGQKLGLPHDVQFNSERNSRKLEGNATSKTLSQEKYFGARWHGFSLEEQDEIVWRLLAEDVENGENIKETEAREERLVQWLCEKTGVDAKRARDILDAPLKTGYGSLSRLALERIVPKFLELVPDATGNLCPRTYNEAVIDAGFESHSEVDRFDFDHAADEVQEIVDSETGEITARVLRTLPYYGRVLHRQVAFGSNNPQDSDEKRYGKIANPTVHIGLNQVRKVVNALIQRYGHPTEIVVEVARELKLSREKKKKLQKEQRRNQERNERIRRDIAEVFGINEDEVSRDDIQKWILWEELSPQAVSRCCPYSGKQISVTMLLSDEVEVEHILPFSRTLDNSLNNRTVCVRAANRIKGDRTPWEAREDFEKHGWSYEGILQRAAAMPPGKRWRFDEGALQRWLREDQDFLPRALNDTSYLSRLARLYLQPICRGSVRVIPGQMTALLRAKFGLNNVLSLKGEKNRNDHRHHAVDACVIGITDQRTLKRFADASASARKDGLSRLVGTLEPPWKGYKQSVECAMLGRLTPQGERESGIWVSHKPDHSHEGQMLDKTAYGFRSGEFVPKKAKKEEESGKRKYERKSDAIIQVRNEKREQTINRLWRDSPHFRYGTATKGYVSGGNWCIEIVRGKDGWEGEIINTFQAYQLERERAAEYRARHGKDAKLPPLEALLGKGTSVSGKPLVMRLMKGDMVRMELGDGRILTVRVCRFSSKGDIFFASHEQANVDQRYRDTLKAKKEAKESAEEWGTGNRELEVILRDIEAQGFQYIIKSPGALKDVKCRRVSISPIGKLHDPGFKN